MQENFTPVDQLVRGTQKLNHADYFVPITLVCYFVDIASNMLNPLVDLASNLDWKSIDFFEEGWRPNIRNVGTDVHHLRHLNIGHVDLRHVHLWHVWQVWQPARRSSSTHLAWTSWKSVQLMKFSAINFF